MISLTGSDFSAWRGDTGQWQIVGDVFTDPTNEKLLNSKPGTGAIINGPAGRTSHLFSKAEYGDVKAHIEFMVSKGSNSGVYFMGRYEIQIYDSYRTGRGEYPGIECGGIYERWDESREPKGFEGRSPRVNASKAPGQWQTFDVIFRAPRFDKAGRKVSNARFGIVVHNGIVVHENVELTGPTRASTYNDEKPAGPLMLQGDHGPVAYRNIMIEPLGSNSFFAMDTATKDAAHQTAKEQVEMVKELGYAGIGCTAGKDLDEMAKELDKNGLRLFTVYLGVNIDPDQPKYGPELKETIEVLKGRNAMLWLFVRSNKLKPSDSAGDPQAVKILREVADMAAGANVRVALYPHTGFWVERVEDAVRVAKKVDRKNVGVTFNLCHWLKVDDEKNMKPLIESAMPHLFVVTINGADSGGKDWKTLIQTLDRGTFDMKGFLNTLGDAGYIGPIGFQGYGIGGNAHDNLKRTMNAWRELNDTVTSVQIAEHKMILEPQKYKSANAADLILSPPSSGQGNFGWGFNIHGDVNRDGCDDILVGAGSWNGNRGRAYLYFGGADMDGSPDQIYTGEAAGDFLGNGGVALGDVNGDGYDDVIIGACGYNNNDGRLYIFFAGADMDKEADVILGGEPGKTGWFSANCLSVGDLDKDGYADVLVGAGGHDKKRGRVYLYYGGDPMDSSADLIFEGEHADDLFGRNAAIGQDVDGDGYGDILIGARTAPEGTRNGRAYLFYGGDRNQIDAVCDMIFTPPIGRPREFGSSLDMYDIDSDGHADVVIGARLGQGAVFVYWGDERDKMNAVTDVIIRGEDRAQSSLGGDKLFCADFNRDGYGDIAVGAYNWRRQNRIGRTYVYYGGTKTSIDTQPDVIFTGETEGSWFGHDIGGGDFNNDGYTDLVAGAWGYNNNEGRAYIFYSPFPDTENVTFNWDTTNASPGKHVLKASIAPVAGEEDVADNVLTATVNIKAP